MILSYVLSLVFLIGLALVALLLLYAALAGRRVPGAHGPTGAATDLGPAATNRWLKLMRYAFGVVCLVAVGFHAYWALFAAGPLKENADYRRL
jgi:hypothetical protein